MKTYTEGATGYSLSLALSDSISLGARVVVLSKLLELLPRVLAPADLAILCKQLERALFTAPARNVPDGPVRRSDRPILEAEFDRVLKVLTPRAAEV